MIAQSPNPRRPFAIALSQQCGGFILLLIALICLSATSALANDPVEGRTDAVYLPGVSIPIADISIERIAAGQVIYRDAQGRRHQRPMDEIGHLRFAGLPQLDRAEALVERGDYRRAIPRFLQALVNAESDMQRLWVHARLARAHDIRGEYAQAASHAAATFLLEDHIAWRDFEPIREPEGDAPFAAVIEARHMLREAQRRVRQRDLSQAVMRMARRVDAIYQQMAAAGDGPDLQPRTTWSGIPIEEIQADDFAEAEPAEPEPPVTPDAPGEPDAPQQFDPEPQVLPDSEPRPMETPGRSPSAIDRLLEEGRYDEALERCEQIKRNLGNRDAARFLYQYGRALAGVGRFADAGVMFTRCAILHPSSAFAPRALIETAAIYQDHYEQPETARRLLDRAERMLGDDVPSELRRRISTLRQQ